jgi:hypothetical protein
MNVRIVNRPSGEAPEHIRDAWIGLTLPVVPRFPHPVDARAWGVLSGPRNRLAARLRKLFGNGFRMRGYIVDSPAAIEILKKADPFAAAWWLTNAPHLLKPGNA